MRPIARAFLGAPGPKPFAAEARPRRAGDRAAPARLLEVGLARADARWAAAYESQSTAAVPEDLARALAGNDAARTFFERLDGANRYAILYRVADAKRPETRARRIATFVAMLSEGKKIHP